MDNMQRELENDGRYGGLIMLIATEVQKYNLDIDAMLWFGRTW